MAKIIPFKGISYNKERVPNLGLVLTPPYDVISKEEQERLHQLDEYNFIRIILGKDGPDDGEENNKYTRADGYLNRWLKEGILIKERTPSMYVYGQTFLYKGRQYERTGIIALLRLEELGSGVVRPHERTLSKPKEDRLRLLRSTRANTEPIFILYEDDAGIIKESVLTVKKGSQSIDVRYEGERHRLWTINDQISLTKIQAEMEGKSVYIADGHHRYETSLRFRDEERLNRPYNYIMVYMVDLADKGLMVLPAHRLIRGLTSKELKGIKGRIERYFLRDLVSSVERLMDRLKDYEEGHAFGMYEGKNSYLLVLRDLGAIDEILDDNPYTKRLDVTILHSLILGIPTDEKEIEEKTSYTTSEMEAKRLIDGREYQMAFFLNPTKIHQVRDVANSRSLMPGKATYFYPKPLSGLMLNKF